MNPYALSKSEQKSRLAFRCEHRHNGSINGHWKCYDRAKGLEEKIALLDIEAEDLNADYGTMFCWVVQDADTGMIYRDIINKEDLRNTSKKRNIQPKEDTRIIKSLVGCLSSFNRVVAHYGKGYDLPFARTRAVICEVPFPLYGQIYQVDTWKILKDKFRLSRNSLQNACLKLTGKTRKDHLSLSIKHGCLRGEKWALDLTMKHCLKDVLDLKDLYKVISPYVKMGKASI